MDSETNVGDRMWDLAQTARRLDLTAPPYRFHEPARDTATATATVEFAEMLCRIDRRYDELLPACWTRHGHLFAILDALRCEYAAAYQGMRQPAKNGGTVLIPPMPSAAQARFWQDEDSMLNLIRDSCEALSIGGPDDRHKPVGHYPRKTGERQRIEEADGIDANETYPWENNAIAPPSPAPERSGTAQTDVAGPLSTADQALDDSGTDMLME